VVRTSSRIILARDVGFEDEGGGSLVIVIAYLYYCTLSWP